MYVGVVEWLWAVVEERLIEPMPLPPQALLLFVEGMTPGVGKWLEEAGSLLEVALTLWVSVGEVMEIVGVLLPPIALPMQPIGPVKHPRWWLPM